MERRPAMPKDFDSVAEGLVEASSSAGGAKLFESKQKVMMFAAALGYASSSRKPVDRKSAGIRFDVFEGAMDEGFIRSLAVAETGELAVLSEDRSDERVDIFEEYAHGGLEILKRIWFEQEGDPLTILIGRTLDAEPDESEIPGIDPTVLKGLLT